MATLDTIPEESSGHTGSMEEDEDDVQLIPETLPAANYGDLDFDFDDDDGHTRLDSVTPRTRRVLEESRPSSSNRPMFVLEDLSLLIQRPKSSGEDPLTGFQFAKHQRPKMNLSRDRSQHSPSSKGQGQDALKERPQVTLKAARNSPKQGAVMPGIFASPPASHSHHPISQPSEHSAPSSSNADRQLARKSSKSKGDRKKSKGQAGILQELRPVIEQHDPGASQKVPLHEEKQVQQHRNVVPSTEKATTQHFGSMGTLFQAGHPDQDIHLHSPSVQLQERNFKGNNGQAIADHSVLETYPNSAEQLSNPMVYDNPAPPFPLAQGTKKKMKKRKKLKPKPALDVSTLPLVIFETPFEELSREPAPLVHQPELHQDQQKDSAQKFPKLDHALHYDEALHVPDAVPEPMDQNSPFQVMDIDQHEQRKEIHQAPSHVLGVESNRFQPVSWKACVEASQRRHSGKADEHQQVAQHRLLDHPDTSLHRAQELDAQQSHSHQEIEIDDNHRGVQHRSPHSPRPVNAHVNEPVPQDIQACQDHGQRDHEVHENHEQTQHHSQPSHSVEAIPRVVNSQAIDLRQDSQPTINKVKSQPRRRLKQQIEASVIRPSTPIVNVPIVSPPVTATNVLHPFSVNETRPAQSHSTAEALNILKFTVQQDLKAAIAKGNEATRKLETEIAELKLSKTRLEADLNTIKASKDEAVEKSKQDREKLETYSERLSKLHKFINGFNNDLAKEKQNAEIWHEQITELANEGKLMATERKHFLKQLSLAIEASNAVQSKSMKELTKAQLLTHELEIEKGTLEKELREKIQLLKDEREHRLRLEESVKLKSIDLKLMEQLIKESFSSLTQRFVELQVTVTKSQDTTINQGVVDLLRVVNDLHSRNYVSPDDLTGLEEKISSFQNSITNGMTELRNTSDESTKDASNARLAFDIEKKLSQQLTALKADVLSTQSLQTQISELRELKATSDERCVAKDRKIHDMNEQIAQLHVVTNTLTEKLNQAEAQLCEHTSPSDADLESAKLELEEAKRKLATADEIETTLRTEVDALKESISLKDGEIDSITKNALESGREATEKYNAMRSRLAKEALQLREEQFAEFENKQHQLNQQNQKLAAALRMAESSSVGHASTTESTNKDHAAALDALKKDHAAAIEGIRKDYEAALESQSRQLQEEARKKAYAQRRDLNAKADREKDELYRRIADADFERKNALRSLEKAKQEAEEFIKKQSEKNRADLNDIQSRLKAEAQQDTERLTESHNKEQDVLRLRAAKAEAELESLRKGLKVELAEQSQPSQPSHSDSHLALSSSGLISTPFKKPGRKADHRGPHTPATSKKFEPMVRTFAEIDSNISESFQIYEDKTSSELTDLSFLSSDPLTLQELPVTNPRGNMQSRTPSRNGVAISSYSVSKPKEPVRPNSSVRIVGGSVQANSSTVVESQKRVTETQPRALATANSVLGDPPSEIDSQGRQVLRPGKENRLPAKNTTTSGQDVTRSSHFRTPEAKAKRSPTHAPAESSSPVFFNASHAQSTHKITTYGHSKQANHSSPGHESQPTARNNPPSSAKRRRSSDNVEDMASNKRGKQTLQLVIPESQSAEIDSKRIAETQSQRVLETQTQRDRQSSQGQPHSAIAPASRGGMHSLVSGASRPESQQQPPSAEHVSQSRARTSSAKAGAGPKRGKGRAVSRRNHATRYELRFTQELGGK